MTESDNKLLQTTRRSDELHAVRDAGTGAIAATTQSAIDQLLAEGSSANTDASYRAALRYWAAWFAHRYQLAMTLPVTPETVLQFIVDHAQRTTSAGLVWELPPHIDAALVEGGFKGKPGPMTLSTLNHRVSVLSTIHRRQPSLSNPCADPRVRELLAKTRRAHAKRGERPRGKAALTRDLLERLLATCDDSIKGVRDRAILLLGWSSGGRRRSEIARLRFEDLQSVGHNEFIFELGASKTNQSGIAKAEDVKPVVGLAGEALAAWLAASRISSGPVFRRITKDGRVGIGLSDAAIRGIVKERSLAAGLDGDFSAHSLRSGFVTEAARQHIPLAETMSLTGHRSIPTVMRYFRAGAVTKSRAARLIDTVPGDKDDR